VSNLELEFSKLQHRYDKEFSFDKKICTRTAVTFFNYDKRKQKSLILMSFVIIHTFPPPPKKISKYEWTFCKKVLHICVRLSKIFVTTNLRSQYLVCYILISFLISFFFHNFLIKLDFWNWLQILRRKKNVGTSNFPKYLNFVFPPK